MGYWVVPKKRNFSLIVGIVGLVLGGLGFMAVVTVYFYNKAH